jgi:hypothetical protein
LSARYLISLTVRRTHRAGGHEAELFSHLFDEKFLFPREYGPLRRSRPISTRQDPAQSVCSRVAAMLTLGIAQISGLSEFRSMLVPRIQLSFV